MVNGGKAGTQGSSTAALPSISKARRVLILTPRDWFVEECCVMHAPSATPSAPLMLAAMLRGRGHQPQVLSFMVNETMRLAYKPDVVVIYSTFHLFMDVTAPLVRALRQAFSQAPFIMVMYDTLADCETQAMRACPELDYAVLPHEKELSVLDLVEHGQRRCPGGFGPDAGVVHRDQEGQVLDSGPRRARPDLDHLPFMGDELAIYWRENDHRQYQAAAVTFQRGCPNPCAFCPMRGTRPRYRDPEMVAREMRVAKEITGSPYLLSLEVLREPERVHVLCDLLLAQGLRLEGGLGARCEYVHDQDLLDKLARAGLGHIYFGVEAATEEMRARLHKPISNQDLGRAITMAGRAGLGFTCSFITGLPWEDEAYYQDFARLIVELARQSHCKRINLARLMPWPGLPITRELVTQGLIDHEFSFSEWNQNSAQMMGLFRRTKHLGMGELEQLFDFLCSLSQQLIASRQAQGLSTGPLAVRAARV
jgi:hypothetical protein